MELINLFKHKGKMIKNIVSLLFIFTIAIFFNNCATNSKGYKIKTQRGSGGVYAGKCSNCGKPVTGGPNRCPYCGAIFKNPYWHYKNTIITITTNDQTIIAEIAKTNENEDVRKAAWEKLTDQALLAKLAIEDESNEFPFATLKKLTDQSLLAKVALESKNWKIRGEVIKMLFDQALLIEISKKDKHENVRAAAVNKITDQAMLAKIAKEDKHENVRAAAVRNLNTSNQALLAEIAKNDESESVREATVWNVTDHTVLAKMAIEDKNEWVRKNATKQLHWEDEELIFMALMEANVCSTDKNLNDLTGNVFHTKLLAKLANEAKILGIRIAAVRWLADQIVLADVAKNAKDIQVREAAVKKLTDQVVLADIAQNDKDESIRKTALDRLELLRKK